MHIHTHTYTHRGERGREKQRKKKRGELWENATKRTILNNAIPVYLSFTNAFLFGLSILWLLDKEFESLADTLSDANPSELMDALRTVESECLQNKEYLNQLLAVVVEHCPRLLSIMANIQREEK